jgi:hypothetical protein
MPCAFRTPIGRYLLAAPANNRQNKGDHGQLGDGGPRRADSARPSR